MSLSVIESYFQPPSFSGALCCTLEIFRDGFNGYSAAHYRVVARLVFPQCRPPFLFFVVHIQSLALYHAPSRAGGVAPLVPLGSVNAAPVPVRSKLTALEADHADVMRTFNQLPHNEVRLSRRGKRMGKDDAAYVFAAAVGQAGVE